MECRKSLVLALGLLSGSLGCTMTGGFLAPHNDTTQPSADTVLKLAKLHEDFSKDSTRPPAERERFRESARQQYQRAIAMDPSSVQAVVGLAHFYDANGDHERAIPTYQKATIMGPKDPGVWYELGMSHSRKKEWDPAIKSLQTAFDLDPENHQCATTLGFTLVYAGRVDESYECFRKLIGEARAHYNVARALHQLRQDDMSRQHVQLALDLDPQNAAARELLAQIDNPVGNIRHAGLRQ